MPYILKVISEDRALLKSALFSWMHASSQLNGKNEGDSPLHPSLWHCCTLLCLQWMAAIVVGTSQLQWCHCLCSIQWTGISFRYSKPRATTKHLNVNSVIFHPKTQIIEIRSSVQQRPIFTIIYQSCPCTQGLITPYMVNKPLTWSRQYVVQKKSHCTGRCVQSFRTRFYTAPQESLTQFEECRIFF